MSVNVQDLVHPIPTLARPAGIYDAPGTHGSFAERFIRTVVTLAAAFTAFLLFATAIHS
jgi:hypothetical protein